MNVDRISKIVQRLEAISAIGDTATQSLDNDTMRMVINGRREAAGLMIELSHLCEEGLAKLQGEAGKALTEQYRPAFIATRTAINNIQTTWPASSIAQNPKGFANAKTEMNRASQRLINLIKREILPALKRAD
jgi:hypothetical protein